MMMEYLHHTFVICQPRQRFSSHESIELIYQYLLHILPPSFPQEYSSVCLVAPAMFLSRAVDELMIDDEFFDDVVEK